MLAWEAKLSSEQRRILSTLYRTIHLRDPKDTDIKMLELISGSKVSYPIGILCDSSAKT